MLHSFYKKKLAVFVLAGLAGAAASAQSSSGGRGSFPLVSSCFEDAERLGDVTSADNVRVRYASVAGDNGSCYAVQVLKDGKTVNGFLVGASLPVIDRFEAEVKRHVPQVPKQEPPPPPAASAHASAKAEEATAPPEPRGPTSLSGLISSDTKGNTVDLNAMQARHLVVYFWSAADSKSVKAAEAMEHVYAQFASPRKLEFVGIASGGSMDQFQQVMAGSESNYPQIYDRGRLADRYHINPAKPFIILDRSRNVVAAVANPRDLVAELQKLGPK